MMFSSHGGLGMASHHHSPSSSVGATMATSTATQSRTPPLSLSPAYSSETSPIQQAASVATGATGDDNNLQFLSFLDLSSLGSTPVNTNVAPVATAVSMAPSVSSSSASVSASVPVPSAPSSSKAPQVPGLTMSATSGIHKKSGPGGARVKKSVTPTEVSGDAEGDEDLLLKRQRNSLAARKYRQKKLDRISELEVEVGQLQGERDALRIQLARQEAETAALREMLLVQSRDREDDGGSKRRKRK
ncbi:hypothetical protein Sste5346_007753 [Sporothrix stenoceras]|uniref:BZIP domain-containing protein n=1 Tax=Sporothrix stenoceras TaxID=5173 RepID=A0ABR3YSF9_9PEZI